MDLLTTNKVLIPTALFMTLTPGMLLQMPDKMPFMNKNAIMTMRSSLQSVLAHAIVFTLVYRLIAKMMGLVLKPADLVVPTLLFILLTPGLQCMAKNVNADVSVSLQALLMRTVVFAVVFALLRRFFPQYY
tara:strand:- start:1076 stop:1468 length:393 start_codon:yes stop_codon:yes gene_type:complete